MNGESSSASVAAAVPSSSTASTGQYSDYENQHHRCDNHAEMNQETGGDEEDEGPPRIWFQEDERWELTWPIWHMLPRHERKALALKHGYKTIGEFEEYMTLQRGLTDSTESSVAYANSLAYPPTANTTARTPDSIAYQTQSSTVENKPTGGDKRPQLSSREYYDEDEGEVSDSDKKLEAVLEQEEENERLGVTTSKKNTEEGGVLSPSELLKVGGTILMLPEELLHRIFQYLPVDAYATLALVSPHWKSFTRTEAVYKRLCERLYLNQSKKRQLHVGRFGNSFRTMLEKRPRVRAGGGIYVMKHTKVKPVQRDMWTEVPVGAVLEMVYYRYIYFQENGTVLYALTAAPPHEMFRRFRKVSLQMMKQHQQRNTNAQDSKRSKTALLEDEKNRDAGNGMIVQGSYQVQKLKVTVLAKQEWQYVQLELTIQPHYLYHGRWGYLSFDRHMSSASNNFEEWSSDRIVYDVPEEPFRFVRDKRL